MRDERLARTAQLINLDFFNGDADVDVIAAALGDTTVRITADEQNLRSPGGQTLAVAAALAVGMMGMQIELDMPDAVIVGGQPPLSGSTIRAALRQYLGELGSLSTGAVDLTIVIGSTKTQAGPAIWLGASDWIGSLAPASGCVQTVGAVLPFGPMAAACAGAADALRIAAPRLRSTVGLPLASQWQWTVGLPVTVDLTPSGPELNAAVGPIDFVSGGAITNSALFALLRMPGVGGAGRVIDPELLERSNLNRYFMCVPADVGTLKWMVLRDHSIECFPISGMATRYDAVTAGMVGRLAPRVLVGVDDIPTRWFVQKQRPAWMCVGSTSHLYALVSVHTEASPCARCVHPRDDDGEGPIPTISFVSLWAGMMQARELVLVAAGHDRAGIATDVHPFGLHGARAVREYRAGRVASCPICGAVQTAGQPQQAD